MKNIIKKNCLFTLGLVMALVAGPVSVKAEGGYLETNAPSSKNTQYGLGIAPNFNAPGYVAEVFDETETKYNKSKYETNMSTTKEYTIAPYSRFRASTNASKGAYTVTIPTTLPSEIGTSDKSLGGEVGDWEIYNRYLDGNKVPNKPYFLFPRNARQADDVDKKEVERVQNLLVGSLNEAIKWVTDQVKWDPTDKNERIKDFFFLSGSLANIKETGEFEFKGVKFVAKWENQANKSGKLTLINKSNNEELKNLYYQLNIYKDVADQKEKENRSGTETTDKSLSKLNWNQVVYYGNANYIATGTTSNNMLYELNKSEASLFEKLLTSLLTTLVNGIRTLLNLQGIEELMLGKGEMYDWHGIAPTEWLNFASALFWVFTVLAVVLILGAIVKLFSSNLVNSMNVTSRVTLIEGVKDIIIAGIMLAFIHPAFNLIALFNSQFVEIMAELTHANKDMLESGGMYEMLIESQGALAGVLLALFYVGLEIYFNGVYILRALAVCILYGLAPIFIVLYAFGGQYKSICMRFFKEIIGNIMMGSFYAILITFFGLFFMEGSDKSLFVGLVVFWGFIPMSKLFKQLTGVGESSFIGETASMAQGKIEGYGKKITGGGVGAVADGAAMVAGGVKQARAVNKENKRKIEDGEVTGNLSSYGKNFMANTARVAGAVGTQMVGNVLGSKEIKQNGRQQLTNAIQARAVEGGGGGGNAKSHDGHCGDGYAGTTINENQNYEHKFETAKLKGVLDTKMSNGGSSVEQTYDKEFIENNSGLFQKLDGSTGKDGQVHDKDLKAQGIVGYHKHDDGTATIAYSSRALDVKNVRKDGKERIIVERGNSTTMATANLTDQINSLADATNKITEAANKNAETASNASDAVNTLNNK